MVPSTDSVSTNWPPACCALLLRSPQIGRKDRKEQMPFVVYEGGAVSETEREQAPHYKFTAADLLDAISKVDEQWQDIMSHTSDEEDSDDEEESDDSKDSKRSGSPSKKAWRPPPLVLPSRCHRWHAIVITFVYPQRPKRAAATKKGKKAYVTGNGHSIKLFVSSKEIKSLPGFGGLGCKYGVGPACLLRLTRSVPHRHALCPQRMATSWCPGL